MSINVYLKREINGDPSFRVVSVTKATIATLNLDWKVDKWVLFMSQLTENIPTWLEQYVSSLSAIEEIHPLTLGNHPRECGMYRLDYHRTTTARVEYNGSHYVMRLEGFSLLRIRELRDAFMKGTILPYESWSVPQMKRESE